VAGRQVQTPSAWFNLTASEFRRTMEMAENQFSYHWAGESPRPSSYPGGIVFESDEIGLVNYYQPITTCNCQGCQGALTETQREEYNLWRAREDEINRETDARRVEVDHARRMRRERENRPVNCNICGEERPRRNTFALPNDERGCTNCWKRCGNCNSVHKVTDLTEHRSMYGDISLLCSECVGTCAECSTTRPLPQLHRAVDEDDSTLRFCTDCTYYCDYCGNRYTEQCTCVSGRRGSGAGRGVTHYAKTHGKHWLGGPKRKAEVEKDDRYYLGFELEITSSEEDESDVRPVYEWAEENLGYNDGLDCKQDSSVNGFEIATQPMTPEFFESVDWESFFDILNENFPMYRSRPEPTGHGLHVHISRKAFKNDDIAMAAFCYLINQDDHLERIARRAATTYCKKVDKPVSHAIKKANQETGKHLRQAQKRSMRDIYLDRNAINLLNGNTIEIRAFRSTRDPEELKDAVRLVYVAAEYIRSLRAGKGMVSPKALHWSVFSQWVLKNYPAAYESIAGKSMPAMVDA
jgi:hypothetical protein